jgi:hypothetical protein
MFYVLAIVAGIVGAVVGWFITSVVALWLAGLCGMSDFEGGRAMFAFFAVGPPGGLIAMVASAWLVQRAWRRADHIDAGGAEQPHAAPADDPIEMRYRVQPAGDD